MKRTTLFEETQKLQRYELSNVIPDLPRMVRYDKGYYVRFDDVVEMVSKRIRKKSDVVK